MGQDEEWEQIKREEMSWLDRWMNQTDAEFKAVRQHVKARGYPSGWTEPRGVQWAYQEQEGPQYGSVIDFTDRLQLQPCPECGAEAYAWFAPDGLMQIRYRCGHVPARDDADQYDDD